MQERFLGSSDLVLFDKSYKLLLNRVITVRMNRVHWTIKKYLPKSVAFSRYIAAKIKNKKNILFFVTPKQLHFHWKS